MRCALLPVVAALAAALGLGGCLASPTSSPPRASAWSPPAPSPGGPAIASARPAPIASAPPAPLPTALQEDARPAPSPHIYGRESRVGLLAAIASQGGERDFVPGVEYEQHLDDRWGVGGFLNFFGNDLDLAFLAFSLYYRPQPEIAFNLSPGYQFVNGEDNRWALRAGMVYEFPLARPWTLGPAVYTDFIEGGELVSVIGLVLSYSR